VASGQEGTVVGLTKIEDKNYCEVLLDDGSQRRCKTDSRLAWEVEYIGWEAPTLSDKFQNAIKSIFDQYAFDNGVNG